MNRYSSNGTEVYDSDLVNTQDPTIATATTYENATLIARALNYQMTIREYLNALQQDMAALAQKVK